MNFMKYVISFLCLLLVSTVSMGCDEKVELSFNIEFMNKIEDSCRWYSISFPSQIKMNGEVHSVKYVSENSNGAVYFSTYLMAGKSNGFRAVNLCLPAESNNNNFLVVHYVKTDISGVKSSCSNNAFIYLNEINENKSGIMHLTEQ